MIALIAVSVALVACTSNDPALRRNHASKLALDAGWSRATLEAGKFSLIAFTSPDMAQNNILTIYIEGDGFAWIDASTPSFDPTPRNPIALRLAIRDPNKAVAYLARPCQYTYDSERNNCRTQYWTTDRFAPEVIEATNQAVNQLKTNSGAKKIRIIGYSGGAAVAALVAARRGDVMMLVTVAGNLDHRAWTKMHGVTPLSGSLNSADYAQALHSIPQQHYVGGRDTNIDVSITQSYVSNFPAPLPFVTVVPSYTHFCCWEDKWPELVNQNFGLPKTTK
ncbi:putative alpha/beta-Hydrolase [Herminiimonas arsenicoxydans]|uniref:Alpha/beta-Hydrolase n=1 Tax=Herminiimonas arsenicoxydans TaxID=204773 RepID=A4G2R3_HERAR|nr:putative alpha/beta-Hydrolase [Herminiimonas arsenicoxydans]